jgi:hypothetical protein
MKRSRTVVEGLYRLALGKLAVVEKGACKLTRGDWVSQEGAEAAAEAIGEEWSVQRENG